MAVKMRMTRLGDKKNPFYRIVVIDSHKARDGEYVDLIGTYDPLHNPPVAKINQEKAKYWLTNGVQPSDTVRDILVKEGLLASRKIKHVNGKSVDYGTAHKEQPAEQPAQEPEQPAEQPTEA